MPSFSDKSQAKLETCHQDLQMLFNYVVQHYDCTVLSGYRSPEEQFELYKKGRMYIGGKWIVQDKGKVVTYKNGTTKKSKHNLKPSPAIDVVPSPVKWNDTYGFYHFAGFVKGIAIMLKSYGAIEHGIEWGGDWAGFKDYPHYQLI